MNRHAPAHLSNDAANLWKGILKDYEITDCHDFKTLESLCETVDVIQQAKAAIARDGPYLTNRHGEVRPHPGIAVIRDAKMLFARLLKSLKLDQEPRETGKKYYKRSY